jgi:hypothetical protein
VGNGQPARRCAGQSGRNEGRPRMAKRSGERFAGLAGTEAGQYNDLCSFSVVVADK